MRTSSGAGAAYLLGVAAAVGCYDVGTRWEGAPPATLPAAPPCAVGAQRCALGKVQACAVDPNAGPVWTDVEDCAATGKVCAPTLFQCTACVPDQQFCDGQQAKLCHHDGSA